MDNFSLIALCFIILSLWGYGIYRLEMFMNASKSEEVPQSSPEPRGTDLKRVHPVNYLLALVTCILGGYVIDSTVGMTVLGNMLAAGISIFGFFCFVMIFVSAYHKVTRK